MLRGRWARSIINALVFERLDQFYALHYSEPEAIDRLRFDSGITIAQFPEVLERNSREGQRHVGYRFRRSGLRRCGCWFSGGAAAGPVGGRVLRGDRLS